MKEVFPRAAAEREAEVVALSERAQPDAAHEASSALCARFVAEGAQVNHFEASAQVAASAQAEAPALDGPSAPA